MFCGEAERLFDAYLDGELSGTLRLELDAHRLRCRHCQQTLAMLDSCGHVISTDRRMPELGESFADRVMSTIGQRATQADVRRDRVLRLRTHRTVRLGVGILSAAAVIVFALFVPSLMTPRVFHMPATTPGAGTGVAHGGVADGLLVPPNVDWRQLGREFIYTRVEQGLRVTGDTRRLARLSMYFADLIPDAVVEASSNPNLLSPIGLIESHLRPAPNAAPPEHEDGTHFAL